MKTANSKNWLVDSIIVIGLAGTAVFLVPLVCALFACLLLLHNPRGTLFWIEFLTEQLLPYAAVGGMLGLASGWLIRHRNIFIACLPAVLTSAFYALFLFFGPDPLPRTWTWFDLVIIGGWLLLIAASFPCAWFILRTRRLIRCQAV